MIGLINPLPADCRDGVLVLSVIVDAIETKNGVVVKYNNTQMIFDKWRLDSTMVELLRVIFVG